MATRSELKNYFDDRLAQLAYEKAQEAVPASMIDAGIVGKVDPDRYVREKIYQARVDLRENARTAYDDYREQSKRAAARRNYEDRQRVNAGQAQSYLPVSRAIEESNARIRYNQALRAVDADRYSIGDIYSNDFEAREAERQRREDNEARLAAAELALERLGANPRQQTNVGQLVQGMLYQGADQAVTGLAATADWLNRQAHQVLLGWTPEEYDQSDTLTRQFLRDQQRRTEQNRAYFSENAQTSTVAKIADEVGTATVAALPQALLAVATAGTSAGATMTTEGLSAIAGMEAAQAAGGTAALSYTARAATESMLKNPQYWASFADVLGRGYEDARSAGADDASASYYAVINGILNAAVEIGGGGIQEIPDAVKRGGESALRTWVDGMLDEGKEEVLQGIIERNLQNLVYGAENPVFSTTDERAVLNPVTSAKEFGMGAAVGGILGGGELATQQVWNRAAQTPAANVTAEAVPNYGALDEPNTPQTVTETRETAGITPTENAPTTARRTQEGANTAVTHIDNRSMAEVGSRKINAFSFDHPELHPYYAQAANILINDAANSTENRGWAYSNRRGEDGRKVGRYYQQQSSSLLDDIRAEGYSLPQIVDAAQRIIENHGQENVAAAKRVEIILDNMLTNGYTTSYGQQIAPNSAYIEAKAALPGGSSEADIRERQIRQAYELTDALEGVPSAEEQARRESEIAAARATITGEAGARMVNEYARSMTEAGEIGNSGAYALLSMYNGTENASDFLRDMTRFYNAGRDGRSIGSVAASETLNEAQRDAAYQAGQYDAENTRAEVAEPEQPEDWNAEGREADARTEESRRKPVTRYRDTRPYAERVRSFRQEGVTNREARAFVAIEDVLGVKIRMADSIEGPEGQSSGANASYNDGVITIARDAEQPTQVSLVHETVHRLKELSPESYDTLEAFVRENMDESLFAFNEDLRRRQGYAESELSEEVVADAFGRILRNADLAKSFATQHRSVWQKLGDFLQDILDRVRRAIRGGGKQLSGPQLDAYRELQSSVERMLALYENAVAAASESETAATAGGGARYSLKTDSEGRKLSEEQAEYFKDSKVRDADGNLLTMYHGTTNYGEITKFRKGRSGWLGPGIYLSSVKSTAQRYADAMGPGNGTLYELYANVTNPIVVTSANPVPEILFAAYGRESVYKARSAKQSNDPQIITPADIKKLQSKGYDGIRWDFGKSTEVSVFSPEQIKRTDNLTPTQNPDIRLSKSDRELLDEYIERYGAIPKGEKPARDVDTPRRTKPRNKVSQTVRTVLEAKATPEDTVPNIEALVANDTFSYTPYSDKAAILDAETEIGSKGWSKALTDWSKNVERGDVSKHNTAVGWALYNNAANNGNTEAALSILRDIVKHQRNAAQAVQATRILKQLNPETQLYNVEKTVAGLRQDLIDRYGDKAPDLEIDEFLAEQFIQARTDGERAKILRDIYRDIGRQMPTRWTDRWNAWRYLAMLGNARTHVRNIAGNLGFAPVVGVKDVLATGIESAVSFVNPNFNRTKANIIGKNGGALLKASFADYANMEETALGGGKYNDLANANRYIEEGRRIFGNTKAPFWNQTGGRALEALRKFNGTALDKEDVWFSRPHYALAMAQYAKAHGITSQQIARGEGVEAAREYALREAQKATYRDTNEFSQTVSRLGRGAGRSGNKFTRGVSTLVEGVLPFRKTPANILARGVEYSPLGLMKSVTYDLAQVKKGNITGADMIDHLSAGLTGTGLLALGIYLAAQGLVRGHGGDDEKKKGFEELQGHQAYALELPDGTSVTLDWLAPECLPFFVGVNLYELTQGGEKDMNLSTLFSALGNATEPMLEMSCLQSLNDVFEAVGYAKEGDINALTSAVASAATSYLTQAQPTLLGQAERTAENRRYTTYTEKNNFLTGDMQYAIGRASARTPGLDYHQIPYIDAWGREELTGAFLTRAANNFFNPAFTSKVDESAMEKELTRLYNATGEGGVFPQRAPKYFNVGGERKNLTGVEYVKYATARGRTAYTIIGRMTENADYRALNNAEKVAAIKDAYTYADQTARTLVGGEITESWVDKARGGDQIGISPEQYILARNRTKEIEGVKDYAGDTIANSRGLLVMQSVYGINGLNDRQRQYLFQSFGVGDKVIQLNRAAVEEKIAAFPTAQTMEQQRKRQQTLRSDLQSSALWSKANEAQREKAQTAVDALVTGNSTGAGYQEKIDGGKDVGLSESEYMLYLLARDMYDEPTEKGKYGSYTNAEIENAINAIPGLSDRERGYLWTAQGKSEKSNPWG